MLSLAVRPARPTQGGLDADLCGSLTQLTQNSTGVDRPMIPVDCAARLQMPDAGLAVAVAVGAVGAHGVRPDHFVEGRPGGDCPGEVHSAQVRPRQVRTAQVGPAQVRTLQACTVQVCAAQVGIGQIRSARSNTVQLLPLKFASVRTALVSVALFRFVPLRFAHVKFAPLRSVLARLEPESVRHCLEVTISLRAADTEPVNPSAPEYVATMVWAPGLA